ncbi:MAG: hypothetical protein ACK5HU_00260 [Flavobacteriales bacterium]
MACQKKNLLKRAFHYTYSENDSIPSLNDSSFLALKKIPNDSLYIINFWAKRSQKSLKNREFLNSEKSKNYQVIQINLDYKPTLVKVKNSFRKNDFYYKPSSFTTVDSSWNGLLPATLFITKDTLLFEKDLQLNHSLILEKITLLEK